MTGIIYTWAMEPLRKHEGFTGLLAIMNRFKIDTVVDLRRASSGLADPPDQNAAGRLYEQARAGHRILLVCCHYDLARCHRHAALALPIAQDAANYALARKESKLALPVTPIEVRHVIDDLLVDPLEYEAATVEGRKPKGKKWR